MPTSRPRPAVRIASTNGWKVFTAPDHIDVHHVLEHIVIFGMAGQRADADTGIGNDDVRHAVMRNEILCRCLQGSGITHIQRVTKNLFGKFCRKTLQQLAAAGDCSDSRAALEIMARQRQTETARCAGDDQRLDMRLLHV